ncbi:4-coumarate-ligase [Diplodia corticola]|uniref:4-coumarate-ligase n=1 Tax=Diplodia corticola TaxID=236234 RepID=A0A1J9QZ61_9PEZI|nr:4-coumarate-ligase [Diplodia corticola]OJD33266.1 4-coumarate-ligase [Diplodia corticola]
MPIKSRYQVDIPAVDLATYIFQSPTASISNHKAFLDATSPEKYFLSFPDFRLWSQRFAAGLRAAGFQPGDRLLLFSGNTIFFPAVLIGTVMAGGIFTGANPTYVARELAYQLRDSGARFLICAEQSMATGLEAARSIGMAEDRVFAFDDGRAAFDGTGSGVAGTGVRHWSALLASPEAGARFAWQPLTAPDDLRRTVVLNYSSGTTGVPKGVEITHRNYVANTHQTLSWARMDPGFAENAARARYLAFVPFYHAMGQTLFCAHAPLVGIPVYVMQKFDFARMLDCIQRHRITDLTLVPPVVVSLAKHPLVANYDLSSVERVGCGAAPLSREMCAELEKRLEGPGPEPNGQQQQKTKLPRVNVKQGWGMTEITCTATGWHPTAHSDSSSVGELAPNAEAKIVPADHDGPSDAVQELPRGARGELWIRAPNVMKGYWGRPDATAEALTPDGWLKTGDIAYADEAGFLWIVDRKKELIKVKGNQVAPAELEAVLLENEGLADAAVVGVTTPRGEEVPRAYVVRGEGGRRLTEGDVVAWMDGRVSRNKRLAGGVKFVEAIPKNPSGKILRKVLRDQAQAEVSREAKL